MDPIKINFMPNIYSQLMPAPLSNNTSTTSRASEILNEAAGRVASQKTEDTEENKTRKIIPQPLTLDALFTLNSMSILKISADGKLILCIDPQDGKEKIYNPETKKFTGEKILHEMKQRKYEILDFSSDGKSFVVLSMEKRFVSRIREGKTVKVKIGEMKIYSIDIATGRKNILTSINLGAGWNIYGHEYIREQNAFYITEGIPEEKVQSAIPNYRGNGNLKRAIKIDLSEKSDKAPKTIYEAGRGDCSFENFKYSPDGKYMALNKNGEVYLYDMRNKKERRITDNSKGEEIKGWTSDSKNIIFTQKVRNDTGNAQSELWLFNVDKNIPKRLTDGEAAFVDRDVFISKNTEKNHLYYSIPKGFYTEVYKIDLDKINLNTNDLPQTELVLSSKDGFVSSWRVSDDADKLYYKTDTSNSTKVLNCLTMSLNKKEVVNDNNKDFFKKYDIPKSEIKSFKTNVEDGKEIEIEYQVTYPPGYDEVSQQKYPIVVLIHGGPNERFDASFQNFENPKLLASQGYVVVSPNIRGSKGYGQKYLEAVYSDKYANISEKSRNDVLAVLDHIVNSLKNKKDGISKVDMSNICLFGFSYGGTTVNYIVSQENKYKFKCAVTGAGESMYLPPQNAPELFFPTYGDLYRPENLTKAYSASAIAALAESCKNPNFRTPPVLIVHGTDDNNVPFEESENFYDQLRHRHMNVRFIPYNKIGHSIPGGMEGNLTHYNYVINWFNHHCQPEKEVYDSRTYSIYSDDGNKRLNNINYSETNKAGNKKPQNGKFAVVEFTMDFKGMLKSDMFNNGIYLKDEKDNSYPPAGILNENGDFEESKKHRVYSSVTKKFRIVFDVPNNMKEFILKINDFPAVKMIKNSQ